MKKKKKYIKQLIFCRLWSSLECLAGERYILYQSHVDKNQRCQNFDIFDPLGQKIPKMIYEQYIYVFPITDYK